MGTRSSSCLRYPHSSPPLLRRGSLRQAGLRAAPARDVCHVRWQFSGDVQVRRAGGSAARKSRRSGHQWPADFAARLFVDSQTHLPLMVSWQAPAGPARGGAAPRPPMEQRITSLTTAASMVFNCHSASDAPPVPIRPRKRRSMGPDQRTGRPPAIPARKLGRCAHDRVPVCRPPAARQLLIGRTERSRHAAGDRCHATGAVIVGATVTVSGIEDVTKAATASPRKPPRRAWRV